MLLEKVQDFANSTWARGPIWASICMYPSFGGVIDQVGVVCKLGHQSFNEGLRLVEGAVCQRWVKDD